MKIAKNLVCALFLVSLVATLAPAQLPHFDHIIMIVQENRTPDNLFGGNPGFDTRWNITRAANAHSWTLASCFDPKHTHGAWAAQYDGVTYTPCASAVKTAACAGGGGPPSNWCLQDTYVPQNDVSPYFDIAENYGFANYMFETPEGPSFPAHLFLFSGTSAPTLNQVGDVDATWFVSGNSTPGNSGCTAARGEQANDFNPATGLESYAYNPPEITWGNPGYPCYNHSTMAELLDGGNKSWRYYAWQDATGDPRSIWNAPYAFVNLCHPTGPGKNSTCTGSHFTGTDPDVTSIPGKILTDIGNCQLKNMSWVMPDGDWSDHPGSHASLNGPNWVASIVNAVGNNPICANGEKYWNNTVIFITWDDWGGWYDHVPPYILYSGGHWGSGFVSGFRVPLLVVSAYTQSVVSGPNVSDPDCVHHTYCHDFGSILKFIENVFTLPGVGSLDGGLHYADDFAPDSGLPNGPLSDFFNLTSPRTFHQITPIPGGPTGSYFTSYTGAVEPDDEY